MSLELESEDETIPFAGAFMILIIALNAIIMFVIGVILNVYTFVRNKQKDKKTKRVMCNKRTQVLLIFTTCAEYI
ncbi:MAG: hypothetical protein RR642_14670 [Solibacillus sp.]